MTKKNLGSYKYPKTVRYLEGKTVKSKYKGDPKKYEIYLDGYTDALIELKQERRARLGMKP